MPKHPPYLRAPLLLFAVVCVALGVIGIFVPGLPTTVFILIAGWAAARSSPRFHQWLHDNRVFGPMLRDWQEGGYVSRKSKYSAAVTMAVCAVVLFLTAPYPWLPETITALMAVILVWLWRRPEPPASGFQG